MPCIENFNSSVKPLASIECYSELRRLISMSTRRCVGANFARPLSLCSFSRAVAKNSCIYTRDVRFKEGFREGRKHKRTLTRAWCRFFVLLLCLRLRPRRRVICSSRASSARRSPVTHRASANGHTRHKRRRKHKPQNAKRKRNGENEGVAQTYKHTQTHPLESFQPVISCSLAVRAQHSQRALPRDDFESVHLLAVLVVSGNFCSIH